MTDPFDGKAVQATHLVMTTEGHGVNVKGSCRFCPLVMPCGSHVWAEGLSKDHFERQIKYFAESDAPQAEGRHLKIRIVRVGHQKGATFGMSLFDPVNYVQAVAGISQEVSQQLQNPSRQVLALEVQNYVTARVQLPIFQSKRERRQATPCSHAGRNDDTDKVSDVLRDMTMSTASVDT